MTFYHCALESTQPQQSMYKKDDYIYFVWYILVFLVQFVLLLKHSFITCVWPPNSCKYKYKLAGVLFLFIVVMMFITIWIYKSRLALAEERACNCTTDEMMESLFPISIHLIIVFHSLFLDMNLFSTNWRTPAIMPRAIMSRHIQCFHFISLHCLIVIAIYLFTDSMNWYSHSR